MPHDWEVWEHNGSGVYNMTKTVTATGVNEALDLAYEDNTDKWKYIKKVKNGKKDEKIEENSQINE